MKSILLSLPLVVFSSLALAIPNGHNCSGVMTRTQDGVTEGTSVQFYLATMDSGSEPKKFIMTSSDIITEATAVAYRNEAKEVDLQVRKIDANTNITLKQINKFGFGEKNSPDEKVSLIKMTAVPLDNDLKPTSDGPMTGFLTCTKFGG